MAAMPLFFALMAYLNFVDQRVFRREYHVAKCVFFAVVTAWLVWNSLLNRYQVTDAGLVVTRLWMTRLIPWEEIDEMTCWRPVHLVFIKGKGRTLVTVSIQLLGGRTEMLAEISHRSQCKLSPNLEGVVTR